MVVYILGTFLYNLALLSKNTEKRRGARKKTKVERLQRANPFKSMHDYCIKGNITQMFYDIDLFDVVVTNHEFCRYVMYISKACSRSIQN